MDVGTNFSLVCKDKVRVTWKLPEHVALGDVVIDVQDGESFDAGYPYASRLTLNSVDHTVVGFYYCVQVDEESEGSLEVLVDLFKATPFYIFVDGKRYTLIIIVTVIKLLTFL